MIEFLKGEEAKLKVESKDVAILNVTASWCGPCQMFAPILEEISESTTVVKVDLDANREFANQMEVRGVPTTFIFKKGQVAEKIVGYVPKEVLEAKIEALQ